MKLALSLFFLLFCRTLFSQEDALSNYINQIETVSFRDTLFLSDSSVQLKFQKVANKASENFLIGKLEEEVPLPPYCGTFAWAAVYKFKIIETDLITNEKYLLVIMKCPRMHRKNYFKKGAIFKGTISTDSGVDFSWMIQNKYEKENLPTFWAINFYNKKKIK